MEVVFGGISSLLYGAADFLGGEGARRAPAAAIVFWAGVISFPSILVVALLVGGEAGVADYLLGALAGTSGAIGLVFLFAGLGRGRAASVAPVAAAIAAIVPVVVAVIEGERPTLLAWLGVTVAVPAIALCAWVADTGDGERGGTGYGVVAGLGFGGFTALIRFTGAESNLLPLVSSRASTMLVVLAMSGLGVWRLTRFGATPGRIVVGNAILDVSGNVALLLAVRAGSLALAAVAASFYPAVTVIMARVVNSEHLLRRQVLGLALTLLAMTAIALG
ncbi:MAG TPA: EamA family transporter [Acidimicrobiia bacterium]|nr:EamA family transporter [Acidimicrobiia bacterium]